MKNIVYVVILWSILISPLGYSQTIDLIGKTKEVKLKNSTYKITIPRQLHIKATKGIDFLGYTIGYKDKKLNNKFQIWIYFGYFPNSMADNSRYNLIDSVDINILKADVKFKIYKTDFDYLVEGFVFENPNEIRTTFPSESHLQFRFSGKSKNHNDLETIIEILKSINLTEQIIIND